MSAFARGEFFDDYPVSHDGIGHGEGIGVPEVYFVLPVTDFVMAVFDRDPHFFEREDDIAAQLRAAKVWRGLVEIPAGAVKAIRQACGDERIRNVGQTILAPTAAIFSDIVDVEELQLRGDIKVIAESAGPLHHVSKDVSAIGLERFAGWCAEVAEHTGDGVLARAPG